MKLMRPRITVRTSIRVLAIERGGDDQRAVRAHLEYGYDIERGRGIVETCTGGSLEVPPDLEDRFFLEHFLALENSAFDEICDLGPDARRNSVRLERVCWRSCWQKV